MRWVSLVFIICVVCCGVMYKCIYSYSMLSLNKECPLFWSLIPPHVSTTGGENESYQENAINIKTNCTRNYIRVGSYMNFLST